ncbi:uncharacterized protein LOC132789023 [Drosophila nasuta]|uniref:uncharacterized protein LOC132789023 n=1 Tax=Drosophila nasuta TaxID=42062 RepID=UPI00295F3836|nr:uncharacterized protein LOC132789023 [Drosophila nasuta]
MPRNNTCRSSECAAGVNDNNNANDNDNCNGDGDQANGQQHDGIVATTATVKQEFDAAPPVCHRKSERRKIARDIFLVFEEQPSSRRRRGRGGARGKCTRAKQKFGHLSVAKTPMRSSNTNNNNSGISGSSSNNNNNNKSSVLREIKTEPKCSTAAANVSATATAAAATATATGSTATEAITGATAAVTNATATSAAATAATAMLQQLEPEKPPAKMATVKLETKTASNATTAATATVAATTAVTAAAAAATVTVAPQLSQSKQQLKTQQTPPPEAERCGEAAAAAGRALAATPTTPSVNPIFLWVKQDDTRIVEVRCEDYDKRNRIRLTKTTNGWRSMPRTDASSSRIVKFFHSGVAQVKREKLQHQQSMEQEEELAQKEQQHHHHHHQLEEEEQQMTHNWSVVQEDEEQHQQHQQQQHLEQQQVMEEEQHHLDKQPALIESVVVVPAQQQQEQQSLEEATPDFDALLDSETNASTKATKTSTTNSSNPNTPTYQSTPSSPAPLELQLCPKTGLFLPQGVAAELPHNDEVEEEKEEQEQQADVAAQDVELEQPKNLKDLLDDADDLLLQQCSSDNGSNNGVELLDSLVKRSCEDNLQGTTTTTTMATTTGTASGLSAFCVPDVAGKDLPSILGMDSSSMDDAPKCLSFNEAGEIEGLHGDLFLGIDAFDKQPETVTEATPATATEVEAEAETAETATRTELVDAELETEAEADAVVEKSTQPAQHVVTADETPKDLSYKKREEVCPPSESRSQCAVTSSSDILKAKSPELPELPAVASSIPAEVETTSETIKNLILEQFLKLNGGAGGGNSQQQAEPMDLGKGNARVGAGGDEKLHTVVIDDEDEEEAGDGDVEPTEPLRKRAKPIKMDKDPDALTQLKMLISNPQWKVPDPILVPKDRLGAVLASPAREIPLLLTTRPELRLPEAFAYPEIIQNPNILVVTMEQLEAILKNEAEQSKTTPTTPAQLLPLPLVQQLPSSKATASPSLKQQQQQQHKQQPPSKTLVTATPPPPPPATTAAASSSPAADSSMSTELNATTLALLQQMLWLPYFGQLSQEFFKTLKDPLGLQRKFMSNLLPLYNSQFGLQHLDELYKHCLKQKPASEAEAPPAAAATVAPTATAAVAATSPATPTKPPAAFNGFSSPMELAFMQKLLQQQQQQQQPQQSKATSQQQLHLEHKRARREHDHVAKATPPAVTPTVAAVPSAAPAAAAVAAAPAMEHKPRLTCKSLSNLLEPESNVVPLLNVPFDALRRSAAMHNSHNKPASSQDAMMSSGRQLRSSKACVTYNPLEQQSKQSQQQQQMQRKRGNMLAHELQQQQHQQQQQQQQQQHHQQQQQHLAEAAAAAAAAGGAGLDANAALWHPLFGSNPKQGYNSPWQWTTVTATGE